MALSGTAAQQFGNQPVGTNRRFRKMISEVNPHTYFTESTMDRVKEVFWSEI